MLFLIVVVLVIAAFGIGVAIGSSSASISPRDLAAIEARARDSETFITDLRERVWRDRDLSPDLATIVLDEITQHQRKG